ncbi:hypothetical protein L1765_00405 [Microaerobacter geothermalis]|uniref:hypothetical protein n=1 Tax=Microaerobacter geothermalis TaxID=674972 RepID=UPI001F28682A|nr:hypothetical protein [Microaerobacter geothermalis]MCF6092452.1 hypothetical protein [Microaerobacter geothermalis]
MEFLKQRLNGTGRWVIAVSAIFLVLSIFFPWWGMTLTAPQYPDGLKILVYPTKLDGQIDIINTLNHYIGMEEITEEQFPEFKFLPILIGLLAFMVLITSLIGKVRWGMISLVLITIFGIYGLYDIYHWLQTFGTNLAPTAPIKIPPFVPPMVGQNQLANFVTYTGFLTGAYLFALGVISLIVALWKCRQKR